MVTLGFTLAWTTAACGRLGFTDQLDANPGGDAPVDDAPGSDALLRPCTGPVIFDDHFDDGAAGPLFGVEGDTEVAVTETGGEVVFELAGVLSMYTFRSYRTLTTYPLAGLCVVFEVSQFPAADGASAFAKIFDTTTVAETFLYRSGGNGIMSFRTQVGATYGTGTVDQYVDIEFDPALRFWRLQQIGNRTYWDVSTDGTHFVEYARHDDLFSEPDVYVDFGAGTVLDVADAGIIAFERITVRGP